MKAKKYYYYEGGRRERNHYTNYYKKTKSCNQLYSFLFYQNQIKHAMSELLTPLGFSLLTNYL